VNRAFTRDRAAHPLAPLPLHRAGGQAGGARNFLATNKLVSNVAVWHVLDPSSTATVLWSGTAAQLKDLTGGNMSFVPTP
jgi:hypothetical protein